MELNFNIFLQTEVIDISASAKFCATPFAPPLHISRRRE